MVNINEILSALVVSYKAKDVLNLAYNSFRKLYPDMNLVIIEGSPLDHPCLKYSEGLMRSDRNVQVYSVGYNIGHGRGMNVGICLSKTRYVVIFHSDIEFLGDCLGKMLEMFEDNVVTVGEQYEMPIKGIKGIAIPYVHPWFHIFF